MEWTWEGFQSWSLRPTFGTVAISFLAFAAILWPIERFWPDRSVQRVRRGGFYTDLTFWVFTPIVSKAVTYGVVVGTAEILLNWLDRPTDIFSGQGWGAIGRQPFWLQAIEAFVIADFVFYWTHRWFHTTRLWPFHAVHHSSLELDWLSSMRFRPVNDALTRWEKRIVLDRVDVWEVQGEPTQLRVEVAAGVDVAVLDGPDVLLEVHRQVVELPGVRPADHRLR